MKSKEKPSQELQKLALAVGDFIRYWGFRRIHGTIWTRLYLSKTPLSCTDLARSLKLSKALISPALEQLCSYHLIEEVDSPNEKTKLYQAHSDVNQIILEVLKTREKKMMDKIVHRLVQVKRKSDLSKSLDQDRLENFQSMVQSAALMLDILLAQDDLMKLPQDFQL